MEAGEQKIQKSRKPPRGKGGPPPAIVYEQRVRLVQQMLVDGHSRPAVIAALQLPDRTVDDYIREARRRWDAERQEAAPHDLAATVERLTMMSRVAFEAGRFSAAARLEEMLINIKGLKAPDKIELDARVQSTQVNIDLTRLTGEELAALRVAASLALAQAAGAPQVPTTIEVAPERLLEASPDAREEP